MCIRDRVMVYDDDFNIVQQSLIAVIGVYEDLEEEAGTIKLKIYVGIQGLVDEDSTQK